MAEARTNKWTVVIELNVPDDYEPYGGGAVKKVTEADVREFAANMPGDAAHRDDVAGIYGWPGYMVTGDVVSVALKQ